MRVTVYPLIFAMIFFSLFSQSLLHGKIIIMQKLYLVFFAIRTCLNSKKNDPNKIVTHCQQNLLIL